MIKLVWLVATLTASGPTSMTVPESTTFDDRAACTKFGTDMTGRMQDWVRGAVRGDWDHPVQVRFRCELPGEPI